MKIEKEIEKNSPKVSVLMPAYNVEKYIGEAIESILNQTFTDFEFIIVDDGSTDGTWKIIQSYAEKDSRIVPLQNEKNLHISKTRNRLIGLARGEYVMWQDADDISVGDRTQKQVNFLDEHDDVGIVGGFLEMFTEKGEVSIRKYSNSDTTLRKNIFKFVTVSQPVSMVRKSIYNKVGIYNERFNVAEDLDLLFRVGSVSKLANVQEIMLKYRIFDESITFKQLRKMELLTIRIRNRYSKDHGYQMSVSSKFYNCLQFLAIFLIPVKLKIKLFNLIRNSK